MMTGHLVIHTRYPRRLIHESIKGMEAAPAHLLCAVANEQRDLWLLPFLEGRMQGYVIF